MSPSPDHAPVLLREIVQHIGGRPGTVVDCTIGLAGHATALLESHPELRIVGLDVDEKNLAQARERLATFSDRLRLVRANFGELGGLAAGLGLHGAAAVLADLGISSNQIADPAKGLSFDVDGPLDMRLDDRLKTSAADLVNTLGEGELSDLLYFQSQERHSRRIARRICEVRRQGRINSTILLARLVASAVGENPDSHRSKIHPATRTFQALRMAVNQETSNLERLLETAPHVLRAGGRLAIISFHSMEDRLVKQDLRSRAESGQYRLITKKPITPAADEIVANVRSRSAKLRIAERLDGGSS